MRDRYGVTAAGGQGHLKGKIVRIAHCGYYGAFDIVIALSGARDGAARSAATTSSPAPGRGAAQRVFSEAGSSGAGRLTEPTKPKVLVKEKIADAGVDLLRESFDVEVGTDWPEGELESRIGEFDAILIRSATKMTAELIGKGDLAAGDRPRRHRRRQRRHPGRHASAGSSSPTRPESNSVAAAEHTLALALALFRNVPQAHATLADGEWARSRFGGNELYRKTLGVIGFGRIGQLVARRALSFDMDVVAFDKFVSAERFRELGVEGVDDIDELYERADLITIHLPKTPETINWIDAEALAKMKDGVRIVNCARGELIDLEALEQGLESGKVGGAALDVFPAEPMTEHPLFKRDDVVVTPHLGASTAEAQDRAGVVTAEQIVAALTGGVVTNAVNIPTVRPETMEALAPFVPLCEKLGRLAQGLGSGSVERVEVEVRGRLAEHDTRLLGDLDARRHPLRSHRGARQPRQRADASPRRAASTWSRRSDTHLARLHRADHGPDRVGRGDGRGRRHRRRAAQRSRTWSAPGARTSTCPSPTTSSSSATPTSPA